MTSGPPSPEAGGQGLSDEPPADAEAPASDPFQPDTVPGPVEKANGEVGTVVAGSNATPEPAGSENEPAAGVPPQAVGYAALVSATRSEQRGDPRLYNQASDNPYDTAVAEAAGDDLGVPDLLKGDAKQGPQPSELVASGSRRVFVRLGNPIRQEGMGAEAAQSAATGTSNRGFAVNLNEATARLTQRLAHGSALAWEGVRNTIAALRKFNNWVDSWCGDYLRGRWDRRGQNEATTMGPYVSPNTKQESFDDGARVIVIQGIMSALGMSSFMLFGIGGALALPPRENPPRTINGQVANLWHRIQERRQARQERRQPSALAEASRRIQEDARLPRHPVTPRVAEQRPGPRPVTAAELQPPLGPINNANIRMIRYVLSRLDIAAMRNARDEAFEPDEADAARGYAMLARHGRDALANILESILRPHQVREILTTLGLDGIYGYSPDGGRNNGPRLYWRDGERLMGYADEINAWAVVNFVALWDRVNPPAPQGTRRGSAPVSGSPAPQPPHSPQTPRSAHTDTENTVVDVEIPADPLLTDPEITQNIVDMQELLTFLGRTDLSDDARTRMQEALIKIIAGVITHLESIQDATAGIVARLGLGAVFTVSDQGKLFYTDSVISDTAAAAVTIAQALVRYRSDNLRDNQGTS